MFIRSSLLVISLATFLVTNSVLENETHGQVSFWHQSGNRVQYKPIWECIGTVDPYHRINSGCWRPYYQAATPQSIISYHVAPDRRYRLSDHGSLVLPDVAPAHDASQVEEIPVDAFEANIPGNRITTIVGEIITVSSSANDETETSRTGSPKIQPPLSSDEPDPPSKRN